MRNKFRTALIGCGVISDNHIIPLLQNGEVELVALCDTVVERAKEKCEKHGITPNIYENYIEMLDKENLDAVHIATPHYLHFEMAVAALKRDINVFLEKPMCISTEEIEKLIEAEKKSRATVCVCFQNRFNPSTIYAKRVADEDGGVISAFGSLFWQRNAEYYRSDAWRGKTATEGGGVMINQAIHTIDLLHYFLGIPKKVCATTANHSLKGVIEVEDTCEGVITFEGGKTANFFATNSFRGCDINTVFLLTKNHKIEIHPTHIYVDDERIDDENSNIPLIGKVCYGSGHNDIIGGFYASLKNGTEPPVTLESAQYALRILLAAYRSCDCEISI